MEKITLKATLRSVLGKKVKSLRNDNQLPAVIYGHDTKPESLSVNYKEFERVYNKAGSSMLVDLVVDNDSTNKVIIHEPQIHPVSDKYLHVDFYKVKMTEKIETEIPIEFVGIAPAAEDLEGNFITNKDYVNIKCLPGDLIAKIEVDISALKTFDDIIHIKDLVVPREIEILDDPEEVIALVEAPISEEELKAIEEESAADVEKQAAEQLGAEPATEEKVADENTVEEKKEE